MDGRPRYAHSGDVSIAYRELGDPEGPPLVFVPGFTSNVADLEQAPHIDAWRPLIDRTRFICFDKRGTGMSDRSVGVADLETRMDDVRAVMDATGVERAHLLGISEGGPMCVLFAATHPDRVASLVLVGTFARMTRSPTHPWLPTVEEMRARAALARRYWGTGNVLASFLPDDQRTPELLERFALLEMSSASPDAVTQILAMNELIDVCDVLPTVAVPTLVVHSEDDRTAPIASGRYLAQHIPGARLVVEEGDHLRMSPTSGVDEVVEFVTGTRPERPADDRVLATVLFTDIVGSTERAAAEGDAGWRALLDWHDKVTHGAVEEHRGVTVKSTGDGLLARFDGPGRAVACARAIGERLALHCLEVRAGLHTGEVELRGDDIGGMAVHIASRIATRAGAGEVLVSRTVRDLTVGSDLRFEDRGEHDLKGVPDRWQLFALAR